MSTRTARRDRRNTEHGYTWTNPEAERLRFVTERRRLSAIAEGRFRLPARLLAEGGSIGVLPGLPWLTILPPMRTHRGEAFIPLGLGAIRRTLSPTPPEPEETR